MKTFYSFLMPVLFAGCQSIDVPTETYYQFYSRSSVIIQNDSMICLLNNPLDCPLRIYISTSDSSLNKLLPYLNPIVVSAKKDTLLKIKIHVLHSDKIKTFWRTVLGDPDRKIVFNKVSLPFGKGKSYRIVQGYNGQFSHNNDYSRYAIDINLKDNDTVCAADDGFVVGVVKNYKVGGDDKRLEPFVNFITLYHQYSGLYTQYVHLKYNGSFVKVGDTVKQGQPIGLVGLTGYTTREHLHFNVLVPIANKEDLQSAPIEFIENYIGNDIKKNDVVKK